MSIYLYANNAKTTLLNPISASATTITVATGTGSLFPSPSAGQFFTVTLVSATSATTTEIMYCTSRSDDSFTVIRAQEGTSALSWLAGDTVANFDTAFTMSNLIQIDQYQNSAYQFAIAGGTANSLTATIPSNFTSIPNGMSIVIQSIYANTGATTLNLTLGTTPTGTIPIVQGANQDLTAGVIPSAGYPITLTYSSSFNAWVITDGGVILSAYAPLASPAFTGTPTAPTPSFGNNSTSIATTAFIANALANYAPTNNATLTGATSLVNLSVSGTASFASITASGSISALGDVTAFSDERLKSNIKTIENSLDKINSLRGVTYFIDGKEKIGVIAQEVQKILPQVVHENENGYLSVAYGNIVGVLIEAIKELQKEIEILKAKK